MSYMNQPGIILLREGTDSSQGKAQLVSNINACQVCCRVACAPLRTSILLLLVLVVSTGQVWRAQCSLFSPASPSELGAGHRGVIAVGRELRLESVKCLYPAHVTLLLLASTAVQWLCTRFSLEIVLAVRPFLRE